MVRPVLRGALPMLHPRRALSTYNRRENIAARDQTEDVTILISGAMPTSSSCNLLSFLRKWVSGSRMEAGNGWMG